LRRVLVAFALVATLVWVVSEHSTFAHAQESSATRAAASSVSAASTPSPIIIASGAQYANVRGLATDAAGGLYISLSATPPASNCVTSNITPNGGAKLAVTVFSNCKLAPSEDPAGIAVVPQNEVYLANRAQNTIRLLNMLTGKVATVPLGSGNAAAQPTSSNLDPFEPAGLASDPVGNLYIADRGNNRVLGLKPSATHFSFLAHVLDAAAVAADFAKSRLYVASPAGNRVFIIDLSSDAIDVFAGSGAFTSSGGADPSTSAEFSSTPQSAELGAPEGVAVDGQGNVFISDTNANAIVRVDAKSGTLSHVAAKETLNSPGALTIDRSGNVFVADRGDQRVLEFPGLADQATNPAVTLSPSSFSFGDEPSGGTTPAQAFTLTNNSSNALSLVNTSIEFGGTDPLDFTETSNCLPSLAPGASCVISVTFTPGAIGARSGVLEVVDSDPSSPQTASLSGAGDDFELTVPNIITDTVASVSPGQSASFTITVTSNNTVFSGPVALACPAVLSTKTTTIGCIIQPTTVTITPTQSQQFTVTLTTQGPNATRMLPFDWRGDRGRRLRLLLLYVLMLVFSFTALWHAIAAQPFRAARTRARLAIVCLALIAGAAAAGCRKYGSVNPNETPPSSTPFEITGTAQNAGRSITLTLNVT
jgi:streptogramin lyase